MLGAIPAARLYPHACQTWEMPVIGFKIQDMLSMYEFEAGSKEPSRHFTAIGQAPQHGQHMVIDLWDIGGSLERHKTALEENSELFSKICSQETFVAMHVNSPLTRDILGRIYAVRVMLSNPEEIEPFLDDQDFLLYVGEQEYERIKPFYDEMA